MQAKDPRRGVRCSVIVAFAALLSALLAPAALASKPDRMRLPPFESHVAAPGDVCPAAIAPEGIRFSDAGGNQAQTVFDNGKVMFTGRHPDQLTNVATGTSVVLNLQGNVTFVSQPDGSGEFRLSGTTAFVFFPGDVGPGDTATVRSYLFTGNVRLIFDASGAVIAFESSGKTQDVCAMIA